MQRPPPLPLGASALCTPINAANLLDAGAGRSETVFALRSINRPHRIELPLSCFRLGEIPRLFMLLLCIAWRAKRTWMDACMAAVQCCGAGRVGAHAVRVNSRSITPSRKDPERPKISSRRGSSFGRTAPSLARCPPPHILRRRVLLVYVQTQKLLKRRASPTFLLSLRSIKDTLSRPVRQSPP